MAKQLFFDTDARDQLKKGVEDAPAQSSAASEAINELDGI